MRTEVSLRAEVTPTAGGTVRVRLRVMLWPACAAGRALQAFVPSGKCDGPCALTPELRSQRILDYDAEHYDFVGATRALLAVGDLDAIHRAPLRPPADTHPILRRAQIQARVGEAVSKQESKDNRSRARRGEQEDEYRAFLEVYQRFVSEWVAPRLGGACLYQRKPILRVVLPGSVPPTELHCDADYNHDANEINFWLPLTPVDGANSLWCESAPGAGDFAPFVARPGQAVRFHGNRCRHYTVSNDSSAPRVSLDFRVIPMELLAPSDVELVAGGAKRGYYAVADAACAAHETQFREIG